MRDRAASILLTTGVAAITFVSLVAVAQPRGDGAIERLRAILDRGNLPAFAEAEAGARGLVSELETTASTEPVRLARAIDVLVEALWWRGRAPDPATKSLAERALSLKENALGPVHPEVAVSLNNLANVHQALGEYPSALRLHERALAIYQEALFPEETAIAVTLERMGRALLMSGDLVAARERLERALEITEDTDGAEAVGVAHVLTWLATVEAEEGRYRESQRLFERCVEIEARAHGPDHIHLGTALNNVGWIRFLRGDYAGAVLDLERSLAIHERTADPDDYVVASLTLHSAGEMYRFMGDAVSARPLLERALAIQEQNLPAKHPDTAQTLNSLGLLYADLGDHVRAERLLRRALEIRERALGPDSFDTTESLHDLGALLVSLDRIPEAAPILERALAVREAVLGPDHPELAESLTLVASLRQRMGDVRAAVALLERAVAIREEVLGEDHPLVAADLAVLAMLYRETRSASEALDAALHAERIGREHLELTARVLSERQAIRYASVRPTGLDVAVRICLNGCDPPRLREVWDSLIRSRALVLDEMATRRRALGESDDAARLVGELAAARTRLANIMVRGPSGETADAYPALLEQARADREKAERRLAERSVAFRRLRDRQDVGFERLAASLPWDGALVAYLRVGPIATAPDQRESGSRASSSEERVARDLDSIPIHVAFVLRSKPEAIELIPLGPADRIDGLVRTWRREAGSPPGILRSAARAAEADCRKAGVGLRRSVWDPIDLLLDGVERAFVVPDGSLSLVNLAARPSGTFP